MDVTKIKCSQIDFACMVPMLVGVKFNYTPLPNGTCHISVACDKRLLCDLMDKFTIVVEGVYRCVIVERPVREFDFTDLIKACS